MSKQEMMNNVIRKMGFENELSVFFCHLAEKSKNDSFINKIYKSIMK